MYEKLQPGVDLAAVDLEVLRSWRESRIFERSLEQTAGGPAWVFYEGPPTANGAPGIHHVEARAFKDALPRYRTMKGYRVDRRGGWDCHGLPVEIEVEKQLGLTGKRDIEAYGIAEFNAKCRESVLAYVDAWVRMSQRMGYWVDFDHAYRTMDSSYVQSVWWALQHIHSQGLLVEDHRVVPYCPRCQTALSSHELGQPGVYSDIAGPSAVVRFPLRTGDWADSGTDLLAWTTTPWTLVSNTAIAVHPDLTYVRATHSGQPRAVVVAEALAEQVLGEGWQVTDHMAGRDLVGMTYQRPFQLVDMPDVHRVVAAEFVSTDEGTGLVHLAPAFGADDFDTGRRNDLPVINPVQHDGRFGLDVPIVGGLLFTEADPVLLDDLDNRGLVFQQGTITHAYPHCWRCGHALLYYATPSWYIQTTAVKDQLIEQNEKTTWHPDTIKHGRYGDWLANNVDWALSRQRYWGTPLPIWRCPDRHVVCVGSLDELGRYAGRDLSELDPHRPYVDQVTFPCPECGQTATRVSDVIDVWFDSGAMPFAQFGAPHQNNDEFRDAFPAQFICEAIDQTRGWFYTLMAIGTLVFGQNAYQNVVCVGLLLDTEGRKMSKRLGNLMEPMPLMERHGADAVRWFMLATGSPWNDRRLGHEPLIEIVRKILLTYWNTAAFQTLYGNIADWTPARNSQPVNPAEVAVMDRWIRSELAVLIATVDQAMDRFDTRTAADHLARFIDDLSNWYVRRTRRRFWNGDPTALATLHDALQTLTLLMAPLTPFITDRVWAALVKATDPSAAESVHLAAWPKSRPGDIDPHLAEQMNLARRIVETGRSARAEAKVRTRQPLGAALITAPGFTDLPPGLTTEIADELNVQRLETAEDAGTVFDTTLKPRFAAIGKRFGPQTQDIAHAIRSCHPETTAAALADSGKVEVVVHGQAIQLDNTEIDVVQTPRTGWHVATDGEITVALDLTITPQLRLAGIARDLVRTIQQARKDAGLHPTDRIHLHWQASGEAEQALHHHANEIADDVLALTTAPATEPPAGAYHVTDEDHHTDIWITKAETPV